MALRRDAKRLAEQVEGEALTYWDFGPAVLLYRQAMELELKMLVDAGDRFLGERIDPISLSSTRSLRWLAQIVCRIVKAVGWEHAFTCDGVGNLAEFRSAMDELQLLDPLTRGSVGDARPFEIRAFVSRMESLLDLLSSTSDGLAATWDLLHDGLAANPTIQ